MTDASNTFTLNEALDTASKWFRVVLSTGVSFGALMRPMNHEKARENLKAFLEAGCPEFELVDKKAQAETPVADIDQTPISNESMTVLELPEPFDFDTINHATVKNLGRAFHGDENILLTCPKPQGKQMVKIHLFYPGKNLSCQDLQDEMTSRKLSPNPWHLIAYAMKHPDFADKISIATQWQDEEGNWCYAVFNQWSDERRVGVHRSGGGWHGRWRFTGFAS